MKSIALIPKNTLDYSN